MSKYLYIILYVCISEYIYYVRSREENPPQNKGMSQRKHRRGETRVGSCIPSKPLFQPCPCLDTCAWSDPGAPVHSQRGIPFSSHNMIHCSHWRSWLLLKRNPGILCNYAFLTIENLDEGNSCCYHCFSNMHLKCSIVNTGWCSCLNGIFPVL